MARTIAVDESGVEEELIEVRLGSVISRTVIDTDDDPFLKSAEDIKAMRGVSPALKRKTSREIQKSLRGTDGAKTKQIEDEYVNLTGYTLFDVVTPPYNLDYLARLNEISSPHYAAIKAKVANIVSLGFDFVESPKAKRTLDEAEGEEKTAKIRRKMAKAKEEMLDWLDSCNEEDEFTETLIKIWTDYESTGNGYLEVGRKINNEIGYIGHIPSTVMRRRRGRDGFVQIISNKAVFFRNFGDQETTDPVGNDPRPNEVIHIKKYSPTNNFYGIPDIVAAQSAIAGNEFSSKFNLDYFENKAVPRYVITIKGGRLSETAERNILEFFQTNLKGKNHRTLYVPLPPDTENGKSEFKMEPVEAGTQDSSFNNYRKGNLNEILMAHRVPISKVGMAEGVSLAVARDADKTFKEQVCRPEQMILEKKLNKLFKEMTDIFVLKLNELTLTDEDTLSKMDERYLRWGVIVPNEVRARWGWTGLKDGDKAVGMMQQAEAKLDSANQQGALANQTRTRDAERSSNASDTSGEARQVQGAGRATA